MLTPQQIQQLKSANSPSALGSRVMTPEEASASFSTPTNSKPGFFDTIKGAFDSGVSQMKGAIQESQAGRNPLETGAKFGAGAINTVFSPLAPVTKPIGDAVNAIGDKVGDIHAVQNFATSGYGEYASRLAELTGNLSTIAGTAAGAAEMQLKAPKIVENIKNITTPKEIPVETTPVTDQAMFDTARKSAWKDVQPKNTAGTKLAYAEKGNYTQQGLLKKGEITPTLADEKLLDTQTKLYQDGILNEKMTPLDKQQAVQQRAAQLHMDQKNFLADNNIAVTLETTKASKGLFDTLDSAAEKSSRPFAKDATTKGVYDSAIETFKSELETGKSVGAMKGATTLTAIDKAITSFDSMMEKFNPWKRNSTGEFTDTQVARQQAIRDVHTAARDFIAQNLKGTAGDLWKSLRAEEANLYEINKRIAENQAVPTLQSGKVQQTIKKYPIIKAGVQATGLGAGLHLVP